MLKFRVRKKANKGILLDFMIFFDSFYMKIIHYFFLFSSSFFQGDPPDINSNSFALNGNNHLDKNFQVGRKILLNIYLREITFKKNIYIYLSIA